MATLKDRTSERYGRLLVVARAPNTSAGKACWLCQCDCGNSLTVVGWHLQSGNTQSCGCLQSERTAASNEERVRHGHARHKKAEQARTSPEYRSWHSMLQRCRNPKAPNYYLYGGRGIKVCDRWVGREGFPQFLKDMGPRERGYTIDRINVDGDYEPGNCRWATAKEQAMNRRATPELQAARKVNLLGGRKRWPRKKSPNA